MPCGITKFAELGIRHCGEPLAQSIEVNRWLGREVREVAHAAHCTVLDSVQGGTQPCNLEH